VRIELSQLAEQKQDWEELAVLDPMWAILSDPKMQFNRWDRAAFFKTGVEEIDTLVAQAQQLGRPVEWRRALDFGCGVGRLTRALRTHFPECHGVDISAEMVRSASELAPECHFHVNTENNLQLFADSYFDFIYSVIVLQHQPSHDIILKYVSEFLRVLSPDGLLVFQLPCAASMRNRIQIRRRLYALLRNLGGQSSFLYRRLKLAPIRMLWIPEKQIIQFIHRSGGKVLNVRSDDRAGPLFQSNTYYVSR
jgi:ubiquinone/menaquinone biosynthesis C-methylase UbiE